MHSDEDCAYLTAQIIPYIGNKRRLLGLLRRAIYEAVGEVTGRMTFLDLFSGSGVVSRLAKYLGFEVFSNDWERYSYVINFAHLCINRSDLRGMYREWGGIDGARMYFNTLPPPSPDEEYIARYFCPKNDSCPDYRTERLFYTRKNGIFIDKVRNEIEKLYPEASLCEDTVHSREKTLLLALLLHGAATHTNTSGVFKAYHKGFGGLSQDALSRILRPISLPHPVLMDSNRTMHVYKENANDLVRGRRFSHEPFDIAYIDPPYNQHQYGSNYHMLNTIALWDALALNERIVPGKPGQNRGGIRADWVKTRSEYCYKNRAVSAFSDLIGHTNARRILISYSTEGIIPFDRLIDLCAKRGMVRILTNEYVKYRGGRQSLNRLNNNIELVIIVNTEKKSTGRDIVKIERSVLYRKLLLQAKKCYSKKRLERYFDADPLSGRIRFTERDDSCSIETDRLFKIDEKSLETAIGALSESGKKTLYDRLQHCECRDAAERIDETIRAVLEKKECDPASAAAHILALPGWLKKICYKKYETLYFRCLERIKQLEVLAPDSYARIAKKIMEVERLSRKRFSC
ncbi:MAG: DNA adenine methylase [Spirochaetes bacterium]|nr:DNA adenine methylase [Spirochaetota bacterium]